MRSLILAISLPLIALNSLAGDSDRIALLEKEVQEIKLRLTNLEAPQRKVNRESMPASSSAGWKSVDSWRALKIGMQPDDVRKILGEPARIDGGLVAYWVYPSSGEVTFVRDQLSQWREPR